MTESVSEHATETHDTPTSSAAIHVRVCGLTDVGQVREHNEDTFLVADLSTGATCFSLDAAQPLGVSGAVFGVCDGMGGAAAGEVASKLAVEIIYHRLMEPYPPTQREELARRLVGAIQDAGVRIFSDARADRSHRGMGTTSTIAALVDDRLYVAQVGDSRAYLLRDHELVQVTRDQSLVNQLIEAGQLTEEEAETFEHNNIILQALGTAEAVQVDLTYVDLLRDDIVILCSDGLSGMVRSEEICGLVSESETPEQACRRLIDAANEAGGHDNITAVVVRFEGEALTPLGPEHASITVNRYELPPSQNPEPAPSRPDAALRSTAKEAPLSRGRLAELERNAAASLSSGAPSSASSSLGDAGDSSLRVPTTGVQPRTILLVMAAVVLAMVLLLLR